LAQKVDLENVRPKWLNKAMLTCKLPLMFIVAPRKLYSEQANWGRGVQIWSHLPLFTGHEWVTWPTFRIMGPAVYLRIGWRYLLQIFSKQIDNEGTNRKKCNTASKKVVKGSR